MRIAGDICRKHGFTFVSSAPTRAGTRTDVQAVHDSIVFCGHAGRRPVPHTLGRFVKDQHRANHSVTRLRLDATHQDIEHRREWRSGCDFFQHSFLVGKRVLRTLTPSDVAEAPYTTNIALFDQLNCRIPLENATVSQLQDIESLRSGRGDNFVDPREIPGRVFQLRANVIPQLTGTSRYHHVRWNSPKLDVLLVKFPDVIRLVSNEDGVGGGL